MLYGFHRIVRIDIDKHIVDAVVLQITLGTGLITDYKWRNDPLPIVDRFHFTAL